MKRTKVVLTGGILVVAASAAVAACDRGTDALSAPDAPSAMVIPWYDPPGKGHEPNLDGVPDLLVHTHTLATSWVVREEEFEAGSCTVEEGNIPTGRHRTLRFSVLINNGGTADLYIGDPLKHMDPNGDGDYSDSDGWFEYASCHQHFHLRNHAQYELLALNPDGSYSHAAQVRKRGFCLLDTTPAPHAGAGPPKASYYLICGSNRQSGLQGISAGWGDIYEKNLPGQFFLLTDPDEPVSPGRYAIRVTVNPPYAQQPGEPCPVIDPDGFCRMFEELDYSNNVGEVLIEIPDRVGRLGHGPGKGQFTEQLDPWHHPEAHANQGNGNTKK